MNRSKTNFVATRALLLLSCFSHLPRVILQQRGGDPGAREKGEGSKACRRQNHGGGKSEGVYFHKTLKVIYGFVPKHSAGVSRFHYSYSRMAQLFIECEVLISCRMHNVECIFTFKLYVVFRSLMQLILHLTTCANA